MDKSEIVPEIEQLRAELKDLNERVMWLEAALLILTSKLDRDAAHRQDPRPFYTNLWGLAEMGRELNSEMEDN